MAVTVDLTWKDTWPLYTVFPVTTICFTAFYFAGPRIWPRTRIGDKYSKWSELTRKCWRQNVNAFIHSVVSTVLCVAAIASDPEMRNGDRLGSHHNVLGYTSLSFSLGYFSFTIPWTYYLYFVKGERRATNLALVIHHGVVWASCFTYLIGRTCALYGAAAFACMEFSNWCAGA